MIKGIHDTFIHVKQKAYLFTNSAQLAKAFPAVYKNVDRQDLTSYEATSKISHRHIVIFVKWSSNFYIDSEPWQEKPYNHPTCGEKLTGVIVFIR